MALAVADITDALRTHASASGLFEYVAGHAILSAHDSGLAWWCYCERIQPWAARSGLATVSAVLTYRVMITMNTTTYQPQDDIDPLIVGAADALVRLYVGHFTLGGLISNVDILGAAGRPMVAEAGWIVLGEGGSRYRSMIITLPLIVNDLWDEAP
jgi:hypothetical protein